MPTFSGLLLFRRYKEVNTELDVDIEMVRYTWIFWSTLRCTDVSIYIFVYFKGTYLI